VLFLLEVVYGMTGAPFQLRPDELSFAAAS
jgi:hypothetical protein